MPELVGFRARAPRWISAVLVVLVTACSGGGPTDPEDELRVEAAGYLERNAAVTIRALRGTVPIPLAAWSLTVHPADAAEVDEEARTVRPTRAGSLTIIVSANDEQGELVLDVALPPTVVFHKLHEGNRDIYSVALDGGELSRLTTHPAEDREPTSTAGTVVFTSFRDGPGSLYRMSVTGGAAERLTSSGARDAEAALSTGNDRLAFVRTSGGNPRLFLGGADASGAAAGTPFVAGTIEASPTWSPTADRVAFVSTRQGNADLWLLPIGGTATLFSGGPGADVEPSWSPDGTTIVFVSNRDGDSELYRLDVASGTVTRLTNRAGADGQPSFLPDGRIVYTAWVDNIPELRWLDPASPSQGNMIPTGPGEPGSPEAVR